MIFSLPVPAKLEVQIEAGNTCAHEIALREVALLTKVGAWTLDFESRALFWSSEIKAIIDVGENYAPQFASTMRFYHPDARDTISACIEETHTTGEGWDLELPMITATGRNIWVRTIGRAVYDSHRIIGLAGALQDITSDIEKRLELQDMASQAHQALSNLSTYNAVLDRHALVATIDLDGRFVFVNDLFCSVSGYARDELLGSPQSILETDHHPKSFFRQMRLTLMRGQTWHREVCHNAKSGGMYWVDMTIAPELDTNGHPVHYVAICYDITERKRTQAKLNETTSRMTGFFDVAHDAISVADKHGKFVSVNPAFEKVLG